MNAVDSDQLTLDATSIELWSTRFALLEGSENRVFGFQTQTRWVEAGLHTDRTNQSGCGVQVNL
jgi:hypothetical protein